MKCFLILEDGKIFEGKAVGDTSEVIGEVVFNTSMCGYQQAVSDPAAYGKIIIMTYPIIGSFGVNPNAAESDKAHARGIIMSECTDINSNYLSTGTFSDYLKSQRVSGAEGIDTRMLTRTVRGKHLKGMLTTKENYDLADCLKKIKTFSPAKPSFSPRTVKTSGKGKTVAVIDLGMRGSLLSALEHRDCSVTTFSPLADVSDILKTKPERIIISGGAGNPEDFQAETQKIKALAESGIPLLAVDLGHLLLAQSYGIKPVKLKQGYNGPSVPSKCTATGRTYMTAQNTVYSITPASVKPDTAEVMFTDIFGGAVMGLKYKKSNAIGVAFHLSAGPSETLYILDEFLS